MTYLVRNPDPHASPGRYPPGFPRHRDTHPSCGCNIPGLITPPVGNPTTARGEGQRGRTTPSGGAPRRNPTSGSLPSGQPAAPLLAQAEGPSGRPVMTNEQEEGVHAAMGGVGNLALSGVSPAGGPAGPMLSRLGGQGQSGEAAPIRGTCGAGTRGAGGGWTPPGMSGQGSGRDPKDWIVYTKYKGAGKGRCPCEDDSKQYCSVEVWSDQVPGTSITEGFGQSVRHAWIKVTYCSGAAATFEIQPKAPQKERSKINRWRRNASKIAIHKNLGKGNTGDQVLVVNRRTPYGEREDGDEREWYAWYECKDEDRDGSMALRALLRSPPSGGIASRYTSTPARGSSGFPLTWPPSVSSPGGLTVDGKRINPCDCLSIDILKYYAFASGPYQAFGKARPNSATFVSAALCFCGVTCRFPEGGFNSSGGETPGRDGGWVGYHYPGANWWRKWGNLPITALFDGTVIEWGLGDTSTNKQRGDNRERIGLRPRGR